MVYWPRGRLSDRLSRWKVVSKSDVSQALGRNLIISTEGSVRQSDSQIFFSNAEIIHLSKAATLGGLCVQDERGKM